MRRVVITGLGVISPLGGNPEVVWQQVVAAQSAFGPATRFKMTDSMDCVVAEVKDFDPLAHFHPRDLEMMDRFTQFAVVAARAALKDSGLEFDEELSRRSGVSIGSGYGGQESFDAGGRSLYGDGATRLHPLTIPRHMSNAASSHISMALGTKGPGLSITTACASSSHAIGQAFRAIKYGAADVMFSGGADAPLTYGFMKCWEATGLLAPAGSCPSAACRPFSIGRGGMVVGEGSAVLILEEYDHAFRRGAPIYGEILGYGASTDSISFMEKSVVGPALAMRQALAEAQLPIDAVDYVNAHGTGIDRDDVAETRALREVFQTHARGIPISSTKSMHGHLMGASGAIELLITVLAMREGMIPPTANYSGSDPECDLDYVPNQARPGRIRTALSNSFAFGGMNAVIAVAGLRTT